MIASATHPTTTPMMMLSVLSPICLFELVLAAEPKAVAAGLEVAGVVCVLPPFVSVDFAGVCV